MDALQQDVMPCFNDLDVRHDSGLYVLKFVRDLFPNPFLHLGAFFAQDEW